MSKFIIFIAALTLAYCANADISNKFGRFWPNEQQWGSDLAAPVIPSEDFIKGLKPNGNEKVEGVFVSSQHSSKTVDGVRTDTGSSKIIRNKDGNIEEVTMRS